MGARIGATLLATLLLGTLAALLLRRPPTPPGEEGSAPPAESPDFEPYRPAAPPLPSPQPGPDPGPPPAPPEPPPAPPEPPGIPPETRNPSNDAEYDPATLILELIRPAETPDRAVRIRVEDSAGTPLQGALVVVRWRGGILYRERTRADGLVLFQPWDDEKGPFRVDAVAVGYYAASAPEAAAGASITLSLLPKSIVSGRVEGPNREQAIVRLLLDGETLQVRVDGEGRFAFYDLDAGTVTLQAEVPHYGSDSETFYLPQSTQKHVPLRVKNRDKALLLGEISFWPGSGSVWVNGQPVEVLPSGSFEFGGGVQGLNEILIDAPGKALFLERFEMRDGKSDRLRFRLQRDAEIRGRVRDREKRTAIRGAQVRLGVNFEDPRNDRVPYFPAERVPAAVSDDDGRFRIERLDPRLIYLLSVVAPGYGGYLEDAVPGGGFEDVPLPPGPLLSGRVRGIGGIPRNAVVTVEPLEEQPRRIRFNAPDWNVMRGGRDDHGTYNVSGLLPGLHRVRVDAPGFGALETVLNFSEDLPARVDFRVRAGSAPDEEESELLQRLPPEVIDPDEGLPPSDVTTLILDTTRADGSAAFRAVRVQFFDGESEFTSPIEKSEPRFEVTGLPEATYRAILTHPTLRKPVVRDQLVLKRGEPLLVELR